MTASKILQIIILLHESRAKWTKIETQIFAMQIYELIQNNDQSQMC